MTKRALSLGVLVFAQLAVDSAPAQDLQKEAQNKLLAKRAAEADAYRKLGETIQGLQIDSQTRVRDFVAESDTIHSQFDDFVRGVRFGKASYEADGVCTIEAEVTVAKIIETLKSIHTRNYKGNKVKATDFDEIAQHVQKSIVKVRGQGAPRAELPPDIPGGAIPPPPNVSLPQPAIPAIWKGVPPAERLMAQRAAELDAKRKLVERIKGLRVNSETHVRDFVAESDRIDAEASATLTGAYPVNKPYYHDDELIVEMTVEVPLESVITTIKSLHQRHYKGDKVTGMDVETMTKEIKTEAFQATGMGVPRPAACKAAVTTGPTLPDWAPQPIRADGNGVPPQGMSGAQARLMAARAAELDAQRKLSEQIMGLRISSTTTVREFVAQHDEIKTQLDGYLSGAHVVATKFDGEETATVTVEIPGMQVWDVMHTYMR